MNAEKRKEVYQKYHERCAYCGKSITFTEMQVDHIVPKRIGGTDEIENLNPSCRRCNHYKRASNLETFRALLVTLHERIGKIYIVKVAVDYRLVTVQPFDGEFYFERLRREGI